MRARLLAALAALILAGCDSLPGRPDPATRYIHPSEVRDFGVLYAQNCAGCHGDEQRPGAAIALTDPVYLALADDEAIAAATADGVPGTAMPAFSRDSGGELTNSQVEALVSGLRSRFAKAGTLAAGAPPYAAPPGDAARGAQAFATYCASCHGSDGKGGAKAGSVVDGSYLALISDQGLRSIVLAGRGNLGMPDFRGYVAGRPMTATEVADVVAWLVAQRPAFAGQPYASAGGQP